MELSGEKSQRSSLSQQDKLCSVKHGVRPILLQ